jgi:hypothetical protein
LERRVPQDCEKTNHPQRGGEAEADAKQGVERLTAKARKLAGLARRAMALDAWLPAIAADDPDEIEALARACGDAVSAGGLRTLAIACAKDGREQALEALLRAAPGAREALSEEDPADSMSPLFFALANGNMRCMRLLAPISSHNENGGLTPLMAAARFASSEPFRIVLAAEKEPARKLQGKPLFETSLGPALCALDAALTWGCVNGDAATLDKLRLLEPRLEAKDWAGALAKAAKGGLKGCFEWMAERGVGCASVREANEALLRHVDATVSGGFPMDAAALRAVDALLPRCDLRATNRFGRSLLEEAMGLGEADSESGEFDLSPERWARCDHIAAFDPGQPGAKTLWELGGQGSGLTPRLHAKVEAEHLGRAAEAASPKSVSSEESGFPSEKDDQKAPHVRRL